MTVYSFFIFAARQSWDGEAPAAESLTAIDCYETNDDM